MLKFVLGNMDVFIMKEANIKNVKRQSISRNILQLVSLRPVFQARKELLRIITKTNKARESRALPTAPPSGSRAPAPAAAAHCPGAGGRGSWTWARALSPRSAGAPRGSSCMWFPGRPAWQRSKLAPSPDGCGAAFAPSAEAGEPPAGLMA